MSEKYWNAYPKPEYKKKEKKPFKRSTIEYKRKATGEADLFREIGTERGNKSQISGEPIFTLRPKNFMHVLAKGQNKYPKFKLYKKNIVIATDDEHDEYDHGSQEELRKLPEWKWLFELRDELLIEYKNLI